MRKTSQVWREELWYFNYLIKRKRIKTMDNNFKVCDIFSTLIIKAGIQAAKVPWAPSFNIPSMESPRKKKVKVRRTLYPTYELIFKGKCSFRKTKYLEEAWLFQCIFEIKKWNCLSFWNIASENCFLFCINFSFNWFISYMIH